MNPIISNTDRRYMSIVHAIAHACHEATRVYYTFIGAPVMKTWEELTDYQRNGVLAGVRFHLANPRATAEDSHLKRCAILYAQGWKHASYKSEEHKTHPCLVPFEELTERQREKNRLFVDVVHSLGGIYSAYTQRTGVV